MEGPEIERDIPIPPRPCVYPRERTTLLRELQVGESRFFEAASISERNNWQSRATALGVREGTKFTTRSVMKNGKLGIRIWRVS